MPSYECEVSRCGNWKLIHIYLRQINKWRHNYSLSKSDDFYRTMWQETFHCVSLFAAVVNAQKWNTSFRRQPEDAMQVRRRWITILNTSWQNHSKINILNFIRIDRPTDFCQEYGKNILVCIFGFQGTKLYFMNFCLTLLNCVERLPLDPVNFRRGHLFDVTILVRDAKLIFIAIINKN